MNEKGSAKQILITLNATKGIEWIYIHEGRDKMELYSRDQGAVSS
jgi:hypothetical protein